MIVCFHCGRPIRKASKMVAIVPSNLHIRLGIDFRRSYHPRCYRTAEALAARELKQTTRTDYKCLRCARRVNDFATVLCSDCAESAVTS